MWRWLAQSLPNSLLRREPPPPHQILESQLIRSGHFAKQMCRSSYSRRCWRHTNGQKWVSSILDKLRKGIFMNNTSMSFFGLFRMRYYYIWRSSDLFCTLLVFSGLILIGGICCGPGFSRRCDLAFEPRIRWILLSSVSRTPLHPFPFAMMALPMLTL